MTTLKTLEQPALHAQSSNDAERPRNAMSTLPEAPLITLLTDFGGRDYYVGALKGTLLRLLPTARIIDLSHEIEPGDVEHAAFLLAAAAPAFPAGTVHLAVVDPGVGSGRRILAASADDHLLVAPDNGLLGRFLEGCGRVEVHAVERTDLFLEGHGSTFQGRDRFAPVAAFLASGRSAAELGPLRAPYTRLTSVAPSRQAHRLRGHVMHVDRFGNLVTDLPTGWLGERRFEAKVGQHTVDRYATHYAELPTGEPAVMPGSLGTLELALNGASLAAAWQVGRGATVEVYFR